MKKVVVLGGCGAVGSVAARTLAKQSDFNTVVIADIRLAGLGERLLRDLSASTGRSHSSDAVRDMLARVCCMAWHGHPYSESESELPGRRPGNNATKCRAPAAQSMAGRS